MLDQAKWLNFGSQDVAYYKDKFHSKGNLVIKFTYKFIYIYMSYRYMLSKPFIYVFCIVEVWYESFKEQDCLFLFSLKQHRVASSKLTYVVKIPNQISWCLNLRVLVTNNLLKLNSSLIVIRIMLFSPHKFCLILVFHVEPSLVLEDHNIFHPLLHSILLEWGVRFPVITTHLSLLTVKSQFQESMEFVHTL